MSLIAASTTGAADTDVVLVAVAMVAGASLLDDREQPRSINEPAIK
jgi:hypothetical protein